MEERGVSTGKKCSTFPVCNPLSIKNLPLKQQYVNNTGDVVVGAGGREEAGLPKVGHSPPALPHEHPCPAPFQEGCIRQFTKSRTNQCTRNRAVTLFFLRFYLFSHERHTHRERERESETQAEGEAGSMQGA